jgi:hypothetical protein
MQEAALVSSTRPLPAGRVSISTLSWLRLLSGPGCVSAAKFTVDYASKSLDLKDANFDGLYRFFSDVHDAREFDMRPLRNAVCVRQCGQPGHNAQTCPVLLSSSTSSCLLQQSMLQGHHCRVSEAASHTHVHTCTCAHTYKHTRTHTHTQNACEHTQARTHRRTHKHIHIHSHMHMHACVAPTV